MVEVNGQVWDAKNYRFHDHSAEFLVYLASGTFNKEQIDVYNAIKEALVAIEAGDQSKMCTFLPMEDGYLLDSFKDNPPEVLHEVFELDVRGMDAANMIVVNTTPDTGTQFEMGYATAKGMPIVLCTNSLQELSAFYNKSIWQDNKYGYSKVPVWVVGDDEEDMIDCCTRAAGRSHDQYELKWDPGMHTLVIASDTSQDTKTRCLTSFQRAYNVIGHNLEIIMEPSMLDHKTLIDRILHARNVAVCVDDRPALAGFIVGFCYAIGIPVITFSNEEYPINLMLQESTRYHAVGTTDIVYALRQLTSPMGAGGLKKSYQVKTY